MKRIIAAGACFLVLSGAVWAARPSDEEAPADTYEVTIHATYQGQGPIGATPVEVDIRTSTSTAHYDLLAGDTFTVTVLDPPPYDVRVKGFWHLASGGTFDTGDIELGEQRVGDTPEVVEWSGPPCPWSTCWRYETGDNRIESLDFSRLRRWFGEVRPCCTPDIMYYDACDFDGDGDVGITDFSLMVQNFGLAGYELP